jgi:hypothetical protein
MSKTSSNRDPLAGGGRSLADRVQDRVTAAAHAQQRRDGAVRPLIRPARKTKKVTGQAATPHDREARALRAVFVDLGKRYRQYRERTGAPLSPAIRTAARAFKAEPSLLALVPVAGFLDDLALLDW